METFGEAFATIRKAGVDHHMFFEIMTELFGSTIYKVYGAASEFDVALPFASVLRDNFLSALAHGQDQLDWSSVGIITARMAGLPIKTK